MDVYSAMESRIEKLEELTKDYVQEGPLSEIKSKREEYQYLFDHVLKARVKIDDEEAGTRYVTKAAKCSNLISELLQKCGTEIAKLERMRDGGDERDN